MNEIDTGRVLADFQRARLKRSLLLRGLLFAAICMVLGAVCGIIWNLLVTPPAFVIAQDGSAILTEAAAGKIFKSDLVNVFIGLIVGGAIGTISWAFFRVRGLLSIIAAIFGALCSGLLCWVVGFLLGPRDFSYRVAEAAIGVEVPVDFTLRSPSILAVWVFGALLAVVLFSAFENSPESTRAKRSE
ncbi:hypothetical protein QP568_08420 [Propionimicrobium lymphophilum]|uniref:Uncharacterized protein n=1 Tax=Propionimicrobium lymphophilum ACS-093-V-SCH5 TaxID=883161 RepID=S2W0Y8_9ACTN|nr:hypothetical protein [Propionimicrobium lymphophilum]EPD32796.1 hypothetical protein HMPREF9306_01103 [Propionimicrobium lymphophilum ACS-093-V-SCH5]MDK7710294.1 hypothetical protein [Propionimicrobium lymphophilum]MDK7734309.1 hypothetical protein [Propionimicrobium lymphophilum]